MQSDSCGRPKLSICIPTYNRADFIPATLESIIHQLTENCEVVVLDGGSIDNTEEVVSGYMRRFDNIRYIRQEANNGFDRDCDRAVELATGEYCWLMSDDDWLKPSAISSVLKVLHRDLSLVISNVEYLDFGMSKVLQPRWLEIESDRVYEASELDQLFVDIGDALRYFACFIVKREVWLARERARYYGSCFVYVGVMFQERLPGATLVMADPLICYRGGNAHTFSAHAIEIEWVKWPALVRSLVVSESAKQSVCSAEPWRDFREVLLWRALGHYTVAEYWRTVRPRLQEMGLTVALGLLALVPGVLLIVYFRLYYSDAKRSYRRVWKSEVMLYILKNSKFHVRNWCVSRSFCRLLMNLRSDQTSSSNRIGEV